MAYQVSVVMIDGPPAGVALPVRAAVPGVRPGAPPLVHAVASATPGAPIVAGGSVVIRGRGLAGPGTTVSIGHVVLTPAAADVSDGQVTVALTDSRLVAGPASLVVNAAAGSTPPAGFVLAPTITSVRVRKGKGTAPAALRIALDPAVLRTDPVTVLLNAAAPAGTAPPRQYAFDAPPPQPSAARKRVSAVTVPIPGVEAGTYLVRVQVNGVKSPLATGTGRDARRYVSPRVRVP
jgi:hypothetical protein